MRRRVSINEMGMQPLAFQSTDQGNMRILAQASKALARDEVCGTFVQILSLRFDSLFLGHSVRIQSKFNI